MPQIETQGDPARNSAPFARDAALDWLLARINYERTALPYQSRQLKLDRMRQLLTRLGQPDAGLKIIHVAGTKGKGSTSAMIMAMLTAAGYRTGLFSSPHLERIEERFAVDGEPCTADELVALVDRVRAEVRAMDEEVDSEGESDGGPTYFEITTAMALLHFVEHHADAAILEVGLGGRLDSTNVCLPIVSVITSISFDHMRQLGNTLAAIAGEKAGIIKPGIPVVSGVTNEEPREVIAQVAREHGCRLIQSGRDFHYEYSTAHEKRGGDQESERQGEPQNSNKNVGDCPDFAQSAEQNGTVPLSETVLLEFRNFSQSPLLPVSPSTSPPTVNFNYGVAGQELQLHQVQLAMRGAHQAANAAVALATIAELRHQGWCISTDAMRTGLVQASLPGRVEILPGTPTVVLDTAHNPASARALVETLAEMSSANRRTLIVSISHDKDVPAIIHELVPHFRKIIVTQYQENPRAVDVDKLTEVVRSQLAHRATELLSCRTPQQAWDTALQSAAPGECICITGSFFLAAEMRRIILKLQAAETLTPVIRL